MKKTLALLTCLMLLLSLFSCNVAPEANDIFSTTESTDISPTMESTKIPPTSGTTEIPPKTEPIPPDIKDEESVGAEDDYDMVLDIYKQVLSACEAPLTSEVPDESLNMNDEASSELFQSFQNIFL